MFVLKIIITMVVVFLFVLSLPAFGGQKFQYVKDSLLHFSLGYDEAMVSGTADGSDTIAIIPFDFTYDSGSQEKIREIKFRVLYTSDVSFIDCYIDSTNWDGSINASGVTGGMEIWLDADTEEDFPNDTTETFAYLCFTPGCKGMDYSTILTISTYTADSHVRIVDDFSFYGAPASNIENGFIDAKMPFLCGDANSDEDINLFDAAFLIAYLYIDGPPPEIPDAANANGDDEINIFDITQLITYLYLEGANPVCPCP